MIKAVIFDIDNTLYSYDETHPKAMAAVLEYGRTQLGIPDAQMEPLLKQYQKQLNTELCGQAAMHNRAFRFLRLLEQKKLPLCHADRLNRLYWDTLIAASVPSPGAVECIRSLHDSGYILGIGTDMTLDFQLQKLEHLGILPYLDFIVSSEEAGCEKPDPRLFALCVRKAGVRPEECVFIGDSLKKDILGSEGCGMKALWYTQEEAERPSISHFSQLKEKLLQL